MKAIFLILILSLASPAQASIALMGTDGLVTTISTDDSGNIVAVECREKAIIPKGACDPAFGREATVNADNFEKLFTKNLIKKALPEFSLKDVSQLASDVLSPSLKKKLTEQLKYYQSFGAKSKETADKISKIEQELGKNISGINIFDFKNKMISVSMNSISSKSFYYISEVSSPDSYYPLHEVARYLLDPLPEGRAIFSPEKRTDDNSSVWNTYVRYSQSYGKCSIVWNIRRYMGIYDVSTPERNGFTVAVREETHWGTYYNDLSAGLRSAQSSEQTLKLFRADGACD